MIEVLNGTVVYLLRRTWMTIILLTFLFSPIMFNFGGHVSKDTAETQRYSVVSSVDSLFLRGPTVNLVTNHSALIFWKTDGMTNASVRYGLNESVMEVAENSTLDTEHRVNLDGLSTDTKYYYKVISNGTESSVYSFLTAPADGDEFKVIIVGDNRPSSDSVIQPAQFEQLAQMIAQEQPHLVLMTGDYVLQVTEDHAQNLEAWEAFTNITDTIGHYTPIYATIGNHDTGARTGILRLEYFFDAFEQFDEPSTYFAFDYAGVHFVILNTEEMGLEGRITGAQYTWLVNDLESTDCDMKVIVGHRPMYPLSHIGDSIDSEPEERAALQELFESNNVTMFVSGHDHLFNRMTVNGMVHIISGGGGAPPYNTPWGGAFYHYVRTEMSHDLVNITAVKLDGSVGHHYQLPYDGPIEISLRVLANTSTKRVGSMPEIYFSEIPQEKYYSWDMGTNLTTLTGIPNENGLHTLDVYAKNSDDVWSHERYVFTAVGATTSTTTTTSQPTGDGSIDPLFLFGAISIAGVTAVVVIIMIRRR
ncbi:MAG: metallophosphoesterase [Candidatus Thorarchaeota archaeon]|nr:MAG: hypothetical protein DRP09_16185 [Candidatus Thorarchaeota archaeon]RLI58460.1 MAG: hypothetical protein DRO87_05630 [Candidatus Thorarchaeota archaeon]